MIKKIAIHIAIVLAAVAAVVGSIGKFKPELFMKVPNVGFILWAITGHPVPPYVVPDAWDSNIIKSWIRDKDVVVATGPKSGTTWMLYCSHQIRVKGSLEFNFTDVSCTTPWMDLIQKPGLTWEDQLAMMGTTVIPEENDRPLKDFYDHPAYPFRIFKSHFTPVEAGGVLPVREFPNVKFVAMARNGMDVVASLVPFFNQHTETFREMWGGFPPGSDGDLEKDTEGRLNDLLPGGMLYGLYFDYVKKWWPMRNEPNVLLLHYADASKDLRGTVLKLAEFYEVDLTAEELNTVTNQCSMQHMKSISNQFSYSLPLNFEYKGKIMIDGSMTRNGGVGSGKATLNPNQQARWRQAEENEFEDERLRNWARHGGDF
ncbi:unnamed protein product [Ectocarpus fasciculatus]